MSSVNRAESSMPVHSLDDVRTRAMKVGPSLSIVLKDALQRHYGSMKAAAISLRIDESQLSRELRTGDFKLEKLERADADAKAFIAKALHEACGDCDPKAEARRLIREARARLDELAERIA